MGGRQRARRGIAEGVSRAACLPKGVDRVAFLPKGIGRAACFPKRVDPAAFLRPDPTHESPYLGQRSSDTEAGRPCSSGAVPGCHGGERSRDEEDREEEGEYAEAARKGHVVLLSRRLRRPPPWLPGFRLFLDGVPKDRQLVPRTVQSADSRGKRREEDADRSAFFPPRHHQ